eukprot:10231252-Heterocapsa_arctica.AAC.1
MAQFGLSLRLTTPIEEEAQQPAINSELTGADFPQMTITNPDPVTTAHGFKVDARVLRCGDYDTACPRMVKANNSYFYPTVVDNSAID